MTPSISGLGALSEPMASTAITVCIEGQPQTSGNLLGDFRLDDLAPFGVSAFGADAVRKSGFLVAVGAFRDSGGGKEIMGAATGGAGLRVPPFGIWHGSNLSMAADRPAGRQREFVVFYL